jgi:hypothetical protein
MCVIGVANTLGLENPQCEVRTFVHDPTLASIPTGSASEEFRYALPRAGVKRRDVRSGDASRRELSSRTFWIFACEFSSFEAASGANAQPPDPGHGSVRPLERRTVPESPDSRFETHGAVGPRGQTGGPHSVVRRLLRLTGTSGRPPTGSQQRVPGAQRPRVTSGRPVLRLRCQSTSRPAFVPETPSAEARGCVRRRRTSRVDGRWRRCPASGGRAIDVSGSATTLRSWSSRTSAPSLPASGAVRRWR